MQGTQAGTTFPNQAITSQGFLPCVCSFPAANRVRTAWSQLGSSALYTQVLLCLCSFLTLLETSASPVFHCLGSVGRTKACFYTIPLVCVFHTEGEALDRDELPRCEKYKSLENNPHPGNGNLGLREGNSCWFYF